MFAWVLNAPLNQVCIVAAIEAACQYRWIQNTVGTLKRYKRYFLRWVIFLLCDDLSKNLVQLPVYLTTLIIPPFDRHLFPKVCIRSFPGLTLSSHAFSIKNWLKTSKFSCFSMLFFQKILNFILMLSFNFICFNLLIFLLFNPLNANPTKWSKTLKHFVGLALKDLLFWSKLWKYQFLQLSFPFHWIDIILFIKFFGSMEGHNGTQQNNQVHYHKTFNSCNSMKRYPDTEKSKPQRHWFYFMLYETAQKS